MNDLTSISWFPENTCFNKAIPKTKFYQNLELKPAVKNVFVNEIEKIIWRNKLSPATLNVQAGTRVREIEVLEITLKKGTLSEAALKVIDKGIPYHILFLLRHGDLCLACMGYKDLETKSISEYFKTGWMPCHELPIKIDGLSLDDVYDNFVRQINTSLADGSLKEAVADDAKQKKIALQIARLEKKLAAEKQPKRKLELHEQIQRLKNHEILF